MARRRFDSAYAAAEEYFTLVVQLDLPSSAQPQVGAAVCSSCGAGARTIVLTAAAQRPSITLGS